MTEPEIHNRLDRMETTITGALTELTGAVKSLVQLETEHKATRDTLARYGAKLEHHEDKIEEIEKQMPLIQRFMGRADKISLAVSIALILGALGSIVTFVGD